MSRFMPLAAAAASLLGLAALGACAPAAGPIAAMSPAASSAPAAKPSAGASSSPSAQPSEAATSVDAEICEHMAGGPAVAVAAADASASSLPSVGTDHKRYDLSWGGDEGRVRYASGAEGELRLALNAEATVKLLDASGQVVAPEASATGSSACAELKAIHTFDVKVGPYTLVLSGGAKKAGLVLEAGSHQH